MNLNDYKDGNGNVEVSETLVSDLIGGINGVVESGSNSNGNWVKFADGTMECYSHLSFDNETPASGATAEQTLTFPQPFISKPVVLRNIEVNTSNANIAMAYSVNGRGAITSSTQANVIVAHSGTPTATASTLVSILAIGRWK